MYTAPKPFLKPCSGQAHKPGQACTTMFVHVSYESGEHKYFSLRLNGHDYNFASFEEAMVFCDMNDLYVDDRLWPAYGLPMVVDDRKCVTLEDGRVLRFM